MKVEELIVDFSFERKYRKTMTKGVNLSALLISFKEKAYVLGNREQSKDSASLVSRLVCTATNILCLRYGKICLGGRNKSFVFHVPSFMYKNLLRFSRINELAYSCEER